MLCYDSKQHYFGACDTKQEAALAYDKDVRKCRGGGGALGYDNR
jgi:hypothetical protein